MKTGFRCPGAIDKENPLLRTVTVTRTPLLRSMMEPLTSHSSQLPPPPAPPQPLLRRAGPCLAPSSTEGNGLLGAKVHGVAPSARSSELDLLGGGMAVAWPFFNQISGVLALKRLKPNTTCGPSLRMLIFPNQIHSSIPGNKICWG